MLMSQSKFGKHIGCSRQAVGEMKSKGHIVMEGNKVNVEKSIEYLKGLGRLDENNKVKGKRTSDKKEKDAGCDSVGIFDVEIPYSTLADLSEEEQRQRAEEKLKKLKEDAEKDGINTESMDKFFNEDIKNSNLPDLVKIEVFYKGQNQRVKYEQAIGKLVPSDEVREDQYQMARTVRDAFLSLSKRTSHLLIGKTDKYEIERIQNEHAERILMNLVKGE